ncbi:MAG: ATP-binding cassette domain-containing protein [Alphaproteobacteria bacterium]|nr:ATP-binding cassette domain-containing protein [Alphaproteobacteria bacterium]
MPVVVQDLVKVYRVPVRKPGLWNSVRSLFSREHRDVRAVDGLSFRIEPGERVGFLGPNGAGKTTTLKMLTGLLHPTSGTVTVGGHVPQARETAFLKAVTLVMGQKQQLLWDLPPTETFELNRAVFDLDRRAWQETLDELVDLLGLAPFLDQPTRNLSLGQRMRCELAAALLHRPRVLFLDEPTIGLDVEVQAIVRRFVATYNQRHGATVLLTSHDMDDVAAIAERVILIDKGVLRFDGSLDALQAAFGDGRRLVVRGPVDGLEALGFTPTGERSWQRTAHASEINALLTAVLARAPSADVTVSDPPLEDVLRRAFGSPESDDAASGDAEA